ncbi:MAG: 4Fe-4S dicluster domain-containing protein [Gemmatimonadota bacterium]
MSVAILIDTTRCTGCETCVAACKEQNDLGPDRLRPGQAAVDALSSTRFTTVLRRPNEHFIKQQCRHCLEPACVSACLVGAMQKTPEGPVVYDAELCMGCRYCMVACPYSIPRYEWDEAVPYVRKCDLCYDRISEGQQPACVEACPEGALEFGDRDELLARAHSRIAASPDRYLPHVYGEKEFGGTSVLYLSDASLGFLSWAKELRTDELPKLTWASLKKVPGVVAGMGGLMGGIYWVINRRMTLAARAAEEAAEHGDEGAAGPESAGPAGSPSPGDADGQGGEKEVNGV